MPIISSNLPPQLSWSVNSLKLENTICRWREDKAGYFDPTPINFSIFQDAEKVKRRPDPLRTYDKVRWSGQLVVKRMLSKIYRARIQACSSRKKSWSVPGSYRFLMKRVVDFCEQDGYVINMWQEEHAYYLLEV